jgi:DNA ligase (NAD+)
VSAGFAEVEHPEPMLSLASAPCLEEFAEWHLRTARRLGTDRFPMNVEPKIDGLAVRLVYRNGRLVQGVTRGNGVSDENVTHNVRTVRNLPLALRTPPGTSPPEILEVRGEVYMPRSAFEDANRERDEQGEARYANPRNAASGGLRQLDPELASKRDLRAWIYANQSSRTNSHRMSLKDLAELGLPVNPLDRLCWSVLEAAEFHREMLDLRGTLDYEIDGIV